jgi:hypothetical protein
VPSHPAHRAASVSRRLTLMVALAGCAGLAALPAAARAEPAMPPAGAAAGFPAAGRNAALAYLRTFNMYLTPQLAEAARGVKFVPVTDAAGAKVEPAGLEALRPQLEPAKPGLDALYDTAALDRYDMELDYSQGFSLLLPHLGPMRSAATLLRCDARRAALDAQPDVAVRRIWTMLRMGGHLPADRFVITGLVAARITTDALDELDTLRLLADLTPDQRATLAAAVRALKTEDPFMFQATVGMEGEVLITTINGYTGPDAGKRLQDWIQTVTGTETPARDPKIDAMDGAALAREITKLRDYHAQAAAAIARPDAVAAMTALADRGKAGEFGPIVRLAVADFSKVAKSRADLLARLDAALAKLEAK